MRLPGYRILRTIGKGGMAVVYLATQEATGRLTVLKVLRGPDRQAQTGLDATLAPETLTLPDRLANEGRLISSLRHPHIVQIYEWGQVDGVTFIAMEYLEGGDLAGRIASGLDVQGALALARDVASALEHAHGKGVIHRDVKPANILFRRDGRAVLSDFGIAKHMEPDLLLTATGVIMGSPFYMSPEQAEGSGLDGRSDIYSLGVILYEMLTGAPPFRGKSAVAVLLSHRHDPVPALPPGHAFLQPLLETMLAKAPEGRPASATAVIALLDGFLDLMGTPDALRPPEVLTPAVPPEPARVAKQAVSPALIQHLRAGIREDLDNERLILPSLPEVAIKIRLELESGSPAAGELARLIGVDPALSAQLLRIANSAYYAGTSPVKDLHRAVVKLGNDIVQHVVMMLIVAQLFHSRTGAALKERLREVWNHSILVAALSEIVARRHTRLESNEAMLAGLIHDVGVMPVLEWAARIPHLFNQPAKLNQFVAESHPEVGAMVLDKWNFPPELIAVARDHELRDPGAAPDPDYVDVVALANRLAHAIEQPAGELESGLAAWRLGQRELTEEDVADLMEAGLEGADSLRSAIA